MAQLEMRKLPVSVIIEKIHNKQTFEAVAEDYSFTIKIADYVPYVCAAVHDGHGFRKALWPKCLHSEYDRWYEEDPSTKDMIDSQPIVIAGLDSRFEYDLNRDPENAIYEDAWGKKLWKIPLTANERAESMDKHKNFYAVVDALIETLLAIHGKTLVIDMHSFNRKRWDREVPTWNLGTANIDNARYGDLAESWSQKLGKLQLPNGIKSTAGINDTFEGNGYFLKHITQKFDNTLVLATEISKVYCDEENQVVFPEVVQSVKRQFEKIIPEQVKEFMELES